jgi:hypothetical protein
MYCIRNQDGQYLAYVEGRQKFMWKWIPNRAKAALWNHDDAKKVLKERLPATNEFRIEEYR